MPKLREVASSSGFFCSERWSDGVEAFESRHGGFGIKLPRLREVGLLSEIGDLKQGGAALNRTRNEVGGLILKKIMASEVVVNGSKG